MTDKTSALILEHMRALRMDMGELRADVRDMRGRLTSLEVSAANLHGDFAGQSERIDRIEGRLERIEHRLRLRDARGNAASAKAAELQPSID
jgi:predicted nuclease with TOPRIM domain